MMMSEHWDYKCKKCEWTGLVDEAFYDDDNDGLAMCPECNSKDIQLWSKDD
jgi:Zn finger protein HypA/HybF involved in hydrogenase expression